MSDLGSGLNAEKINQLKQKRAAVKRTIIKDDDNKETVRAILFSFTYMDKEKSKFMEADEAITQSIMARERVLKTRRTILQSSKKQFHNIIKAVNQSLRNQEKKKKEEQNVVKPVTYDRYQEVEEDKFWKDRLKGNGCSFTAITYC